MIKNSFWFSKPFKKDLQYLYLSFLLLLLIFLLILPPPNSHTINFRSILAIINFISLGKPTPLIKYIKNSKYYYEPSIDDG